MTDNQEEKKDGVGGFLKSRLTLGSIRSESYVDSSTGELMDTVNSKTWKVQLPKDSFMFLYGRFISILGDISEVDAKVFLTLANKVDFGTADLRITKSIYNEICNELNFVEGTVRNSVSSLAKNGFLIKHPTIRGHYRVNPEFVWKGNPDARATATLNLLLETKASELQKPKE